MARTIDVDTSALEALTSRVTSHFAAIREGLASHLSALRATDWEGNAKNAAVDHGGRVHHQSAQTKCRRRRDVDHQRHRQPARQRPRRRQARALAPDRLAREVRRRRADCWSHGADRPGVLERGRCR